MSDHSNECLQPLRHGVVEMFRRLEKKDKESSIREGGKQGNRTEINADKDRSS